jgi:hypothetical protein
LRTAALQNGFIRRGRLHDDENHRSSRTYSTYTARMMADLPDYVRLCYRDLATDPRYRHFVRIPDRIIQCVDYFGVPCDYAAVRAKLQTYYLFIGVVDDAIDSGRLDAGKLILEYLSTPYPDFQEAERYSHVRLITEILKVHIDHRDYPGMMNKLRTLYEEVVSERSAASIDSYIRYRKSVGALTAELSYLLMRPALENDNDQLCEFMRQVGAIGCLIDSLIDLNRDRRLGLLGFDPGLWDYARLIVSIAHSGLAISLRHPRLYGLFLGAIVDNLRDPFRTGPDKARSAFATDRKDEAASVA